MEANKYVIGLTDDTIDFVRNDRNIRRCKSLCVKYEARQRNS